MKITVILITLLGLTTIGISQRKLKKLDIREEGLDIKTNFQPIKEEIELNGLSLKITPVSAEGLNPQFNQVSQMNGKFDYSYYDNSIETYFIKKQNISKDKTDLEFLREGLEWLLDHEKIDDNEYDELYELIDLNFDSESKSESTESNRITNSNPYYLRPVYMNVFLIEFTNTTNSIINFDERFIIKNGVDLLPTLSSDFLRTELYKLDLLNLNRSLILERYNLEKSTSIPANSTVVKYFAIPPLRTNSDILDIQPANSNQKFSWKIERTQNKLDRQFSFYELALTYKNLDQSISNYNFSVLGKSSGSIANLANNRIYINAKNLDSPIEILTVSISNDYLYFSRKNEIKARNYIDFNKLKRSAISIECERLSEIKRRK